MKMRGPGNIKFGKGFVARDELLTWSDLTTSLQEKLLEKSVIFQDAKISLNELLSAESPVATFLPLGALLKEKELKIADPVPIENVYNENYYIGRILCLLKVIKQDIYSHKDVSEKHVYLASTEQEFKQLCQLYPNSNVHWLEKDKSGISFGSNRREVQKQCVNILRPRFHTHIQLII
jgi:hypothetical protein